MIHQNDHSKFYPNDVSNAAERNIYNSKIHHRSTANNAETNTYHVISTNANYQKQSNGFSSTKQAIKHQTIDCKKIDLISSSEDEKVSENIEKIDLECPLLHLEDENIEFDELPVVNMRNVFKTGQSLRVFISLVHSPYKFWFQREEDGELIDVLMERLE